MHYESIVVMQNFRDKYLSKDSRLDILDVGSRGSYSYRILFESGFTADDIYFKQAGVKRDYIRNSNWNYVGGDLREGENVDIKFKLADDWGLDKQYDVIISGQCLEHVEDTHKWILELEKYLKPDGIVCVVVPWKFSEHRCPLDCWRVFPDGMRFLFEDIAKLKTLEIYMYLDDTIGIAKKEKI